jgi:poly(A) polymerase
MARKRMQELRYPTEVIEDVQRLVALHLRFHTYKMGWTDSAVRRYTHDAGPLLGRLNELTRCDCTTRNQAKARDLAARMDELEHRLAELREREELDSIRPQLDGVAVMRRLDIPPGRDVGAALEFLLQIRLDEGVLDDDEVLRRLDAWWADRLSKAD